MRLLRAICFLALSCLAACSLDFDEFTAAKGNGDDKDGGGIDGGALPGDPCTDDGAHECDHDSASRTLVCRDGVWQSGPTCDSGEHCDNSAGATRGTCVAIASECDGGACIDGGKDDNGGKGGKGGTDPNGTTNKPPKVEIVFPPPGVTERESIGVRGRVSDPEDDKITKLTINGKAAKVKSDGSFSVNAPLELGVHALAIHVEDDGGGKADIDGNAIERFAYLFQQAADMVLDSEHNRVIAVDGATDAVVAIALDDGARTLIAPPSATPVGRDSLELDAANNRVLVTERNPGALAWIDLDSGERTVVSDATNGGAFEPHAVVLDPVVAGRAFVAVAGSLDTPDLLYTVDLSSGTRTSFPISGVSNYGLASDLVYDQARTQLVIVGYSTLIGVSVANGAAHFIATSGRALNTGHGADPFNTQQIAVDGDRALLFGQENINDGPSCIFQVGIESGVVTELAALTVGSDPSLVSRSDSSSFVFDADSGDGLVLDSRGRLLRVRLAPGARQYVSTTLYGDGPAFTRPVSIAEDGTRNRWIVADQELNAVIAVDKRQGDRSVLSDADSDGPDFDTLRAVVVDGLNDDVIALDEQRLYRVDPVTGARSVIASDLAGSIVGSGPSFAGAIEVEISLDGTKAILAGCYGNSPCTGQLIAVSLADGSRTLLSGPGTGTGPISQFTALAKSPEGYLVASEDLGGGNTMLLRVDATSGDRVALSDGDTGDGPALSRIQALAYDAFERRAVIINEFSTPQKLVGVDLVNGDRTLLTEVDDAPGNPYPGILSDLIADVNTHQLVVAEGWQGNDAGLIGVFLADRERSVVADQARAAWRALPLALDAESGILYGGENTTDPNDSARGAVVATLDVHTGERAILSDDSDNGGTVQWLLPIGLSLDHNNGRLLGLTLAFVASQPSALLAISLDDGTQTVLTGRETGSGTAWQGAIDVAWDATGSRSLLSCPSLPAIVAVDAAGDRSLFSGGAVGEGDAFGSTGAIAVDDAANRLLVIDAAKIVAVDLETAQRTPFANTGDSLGPDLIKPGDVIVDPIGKRAIVLDLGDADAAPSLVAIALDDGTRTTLQTLPDTWYQLQSLVPPSIAFDGTTEIAYLSSLFALDTTTGEYVAIAGYGQ